MHKDSHVCVRMCAHVRRAGCGCVCVVSVSVDVGCGWDEVVAMCG